MNSIPLYVGTANRVYAINRETGAVIWNVKLNDHFLKMGNSFVNLDFDGESLFAATFGKFYCLDPQSGQICWKAPLEGTIANPVSFAASVSANREAAFAEKLDGERAG